MWYKMSARFNIFLLTAFLLFSFSLCAEDDYDALVRRYEKVTQETHHSSFYNRIDDSTKRSVKFLFEYTLKEMSVKRLEILIDVMIPVLNQYHNLTDCRNINYRSRLESFTKVFLLFEGNDKEFNILVKTLAEALPKLITPPKRYSENSFWFFESILKPFMSKNPREIPYQNYIENFVHATTILKIKTSFGCRAEHIETVALLVNKAETLQTDGVMREFNSLFLAEHFEFNIWCVSSERHQSDIFSALVNSAHSPERLIKRHKLLSTLCQEREYRLSRALKSYLISLLCSMDMQDKDLEIFVAYLFFEKAGMLFRDRISSSMEYVPRLSDILINLASKRPSHRYLWALRVGSGDLCREAGGGCDIEYMYYLLQKDLSLEGISLYVDNVISSTAKIMETKQYNWDKHRLVFALLKTNKTRNELFNYVDHILWRMGKIFRLGVNYDKLDVKFRLKWTCFPNDFIVSDLLAKDPSEEEADELIEEVYRDLRRELKLDQFEIIEEYCGCQEEL